MSIFGSYADYYDLLYQDKDYAGESEYIHKAIHKYHPKTKTIINFGCGTGKHDIILAGKGYDITGVDRSPGMLKAANGRLQKLRLKNVHFTPGDMRTVRLEKIFDTVLSLFHVLSYQISNQDLLSSLKTIRAHLQARGLFLFDCWYGPAVMANMPVVRIKRCENSKIKLTRIAEPRVHPNENTVDVSYTLYIKDKVTGKIETLNEVHTMRYFFKPEIELMSKEAGLKILFTEEFETHNQPGFDTWGVCFIGTNL